MKSLTWTEFKKFIDEQIEKKEIDPNSLIWYIDISYPEDGDSNKYKVPVVHYDSVRGIAID